MEDHWDFDENTLPPKGTIRHIMRTEGCSWHEALDMIGLAPERVPFGELEEGDLFRFNCMIWKKEPKYYEYGSGILDTNHRLSNATAVADDYGDFSATQQAETTLADHILVEPIDSFRDE